MIPVSDDITRVCLNSSPFQFCEFIVACENSQRDSSGVMSIGYLITEQPKGLAYYVDTKVSQHVA